MFSHLLAGSAAFFSLLAQPDSQCSDRFPMQLEIEYYYIRVSQETCLSYRFTATG